MIQKRKKNSRLRGSHTHGWGAKKKHRGAGHRGGRGKAGSGKRGDAKKPSFWKDPSYYGKKKGFVSMRKPLKAINIADLSKFAETKLNLKAMGFDKLLGKGTPDRKYEITVKQASASAIEKIKKAGGTVSVEAKKEAPQKKEDKPAKPAKKKAEEAVESDEE